MSRAGTTVTDPGATILAGIDLVVVDSCERDAVYAARTAGGAHLRITHSAHELLQLRKQGLSAEAIARRVSDRGRTVAAHEIDEAIDDLLRRIDAADRRPPARGWFLVRARVLPGPVVDAIARRLAPAFQWRVAAPLLAAAVLAILWIVPDLHGVSFAPGVFWPAYGLTLAALLGHELGHAAACARFGCPSGGIGVGVYLVYPAFYCDVTRAWSLPRRQRAVIDVGGVVFQLVIAGAFAVGHAVTGSEVLGAAVLMNVATVLFNLCPFFQLDGYWLLGDLLGVANLGGQQGRVLGHLWQRWRGRPSQLPWSPRIVLAMAAYSVVSWGFLLYVCARLVPAAAAAAASYPHAIGRLADDLGARAYRDAANGAGGLLTSSFVILFAALLAVRLARRVRRVLGPKES